MITPRGFGRLFRLPATAARAAEDVDEELRFHLDMRTRELVAGGMPEGEAEAEARRVFGQVPRVAAECRTIDRGMAREQRRTEFWRSIGQDLAYAFRSMRRAPGFALAAVLTLAVAIGATTAIFSVVYAALLRPLPFDDPSRLVQVTLSSSASPPGGLSAPEFADLAADGKVFSAVGGFYRDEGTLATGGNPVQITYAGATASLFSTLGIRAEQGRVFRPDEDRPGSDAVMVLSHQLWLREFGGDPAVLGRIAKLDGTSRTIVGVLGPAIRIEGMEAFVPLALDPANLPTRGNHFLSTIGRLRDRTDFERARAWLRTLGRQWKQQYAADYWYMTGDPVLLGTPLRDAWVANARPTIIALFALVAVLLLIACVNVATLMLIRAEARRREFAVRAAIGAGVGRLARQVLTESLLLAVVGGAAGIGLAAVAVRRITALDPGALPPSTRVALDTTVALFAIGLTLLTGLAFGLVPALRASRPALHAAMSAGRSGATRGETRVRGVLVAAQVALALAVLVGAGLVGRSFWRLSQVDPGFLRRNIVVVPVSAPERRYPDAARTLAFYETAVSRLRALPGVTAVGGVSHLPLSGSAGDWMLEVEGRSTAGLPSPSYTVVTADYLPTMGIPVVRGRGFGAGDDTNTPPVILVSRAMARRYWGDADPIGQRARLGGLPGKPNPWMEVIGIVGDVRSASLAEEAGPRYYVLDRQFPALVGQPYRSLNLVVRGRVPPAALVRQVRQELRAIDPELALDRITTMDDIVGGSIGRPRFAAAVLGAFAAGALLLALTGIYGVLAYAVSLREKEMGIRLALGARRAQVRGMVVWEGMRIVLAGLGVGLLAAVAASDVVRGLLYGLAPVDPLTFGAAAMAIAAAALLASWLPARRAAREDPSAVLRAE